MNKSRNIGIGQGFKISISTEYMHSNTTISSHKWSARNIGLRTKPGTDSTIWKRSTFMGWTEGWTTSSCLYNFSSLMSNELPIHWPAIDGNGSSIQFIINLQFLLFSKGIPKYGHCQLFINMSLLYVPVPVQSTRPKLSDALSVECKATLSLAQTPLVSRGVLNALWISLHSESPPSATETNYCSI